MKFANDFVSAHNYNLIRMRYETSAKKGQQNRGLMEQAMAEEQLPFFDIFNPKSSNKILGMNRPSGITSAGLAAMPSAPYNQGVRDDKFTLYPSSKSGAYSSVDANKMMEKYMDTVGVFLRDTQTALGKLSGAARKTKQAQYDAKSKKLYKKTVKQLKNEYEDRDRIYQMGKAVSDVMSEITGATRTAALRYFQQYSGDPYQELAKGLVARYIIFPNGNKVIGAAQLKQVQAAMSIIAYDQKNLQKLAKQGRAQLLKKMPSDIDIMAQWQQPTVVLGSGLKKRTIKYDANQPTQREGYQNSIIDDWGTGLGTPAVRSIKPNSMAAFPQWMFSQIQSANKKKMSSYMSMLAAKRMTDKLDPVMISMSKLDGKLANWNTNTNKWQGTWADQQQLKSLKRGDKYNKTIQKANQTMQTSYTLQQLQQQVPKFILDIVSANAKITGQKMGPLSQNGKGLYAGRWIDPVSGRVRMLPIASQKYVNPFVKQQKMSYLQAKILNKWNELMSTFQELEKLKSKRNYQEAQMKKLQNGLNPVQNQITANRKITKIIQSYWGSFANPSNMRWLILNAVPASQLSEIYSLQYPETDVKKIRKPKLQLEEMQLGKLRIQAWQLKINEAGQSIQRKITGSSQSQIIKSKLLLRLQQTLVGLLSVGGQGKGALKMLMKGVLLPKQGSVQDMLNAKKTYDELSAQTKTYQLGIGQLRGEEDYLTSKKIWKQKVKPALNSAIKQNKPTTSQDVKNFMQLIGKTNGIDKRLEQADELIQFIKAKPLKASMLAIAGPQTRALVQPYRASFKKHINNEFVM